MYRHDPLTYPALRWPLVIAVCVALTVTSFSQPADTTDAKSKPERKSPTSALLRSLVIPGWGQVYNGKYIKAVVYAGAQLSFLYGAHIQNDRYHHYRDLGDEVFADFYQNDRNRLLWWLFGITLLSMGDAFVDAHLSQFDVSDDMSAHITPQYDPQRASVGLSFAVLFNPAKNP